MFVRTRGDLAAVSALVASLASCSNDAQPSDLRGGPPDVLAVVVSSYDHRDGYRGATIENATYCRPGDDKRPGLVGQIDFSTLQVCPADLTKGADEVVDALPGVTANDESPRGGLKTPVSGWYARIMFANLLDPNVEDLIANLDPVTRQPCDPRDSTCTFTGSLVNTQPVTLSCGGRVVAYDGYYSPSGNALTYPVGPSLFIAPIDATAVAGGSECTVMVKPSVHNKAGLAVPADSLGPFRFKTEQLRLLSSTPTCASPDQSFAGCKGGDLTMPTMLDPMAGAVVLTFDGAVDPKSLTAASFELRVGTSCTTPTGPPRTPIVSADASKAALDIVDGGAAGTNNFDPGLTYILTFKAGATVKDLAGGTSQPLPGAASFVVCFTT